MLKSIAEYLDETIAVHEAAGHRLSDVCVGNQVGVRQKYDVHGNEAAGDPQFLEYR